ncbi:MAG: hypothetical protein KAS78_03130, partial [Candidatus Pacebacteria bacterium]|nr:hypothetical protein [Candidatus Paceibacterota bacterium]
NNGATLTYTQGTAADLTVNGTLTVYSGGTITTPYTSLTLPDSGGSGRTITAGNIDIQFEGTINADSKGFWANSGPGKSNTYADGGSYGGAGGDYGANGTIGSTYGSLNDPISLGSGGWHPSHGAGGAIVILATGIVTVDGILSANGTVIVSGGGLGSGGTINITAAILEGSGTIQANGGNSSPNFGSGGGGRIAVTQTTGTIWTPTFQAFGGYSGTKGAAGTIYFKDANDAAGDGELIIDNNNVATASGTDTDISSSVTDTAVGDIIIRNGAKFQMDADTTLTVSGTWNNTAGENLTAGTVTFDSTSSQNITSNSKSFYNLTFNGSGGIWTPQDALDVNNNLTITTGTLASNDQAINIAGNWTNSVGNSGFTYGTSTVALDGTTQSILGNTTFYNLTKNVTSADTLTFGNSTTQIITGTMDLQGASGNLLSLRSDSTPTQWNIDPQGTRTISYLDVKDSNNINASQIIVEGFNITDSDNNDGWLFNVASTTPTSLTQLKNDGTTAISNQGYTEENNVKLKASATDEDNPEIITLFFETVLNSGSFNSPATPTTGTSCISGTEWSSCSNKIWYVTSSSGDYTSTPYTGTTNVAGLSDAASYKWQVKACDDNNECSSWAAYNATVPNFTVDTSGPTISLSSPTNDASTSDNQPTLTWSGSDATSGIAKYQLYVDSVLDTDDISNSATSVAPSNELSCGDHT